MSNVHIRHLTKQDAQVIFEAFQEQGWHKPLELYERYWEEQQNGKRVTLIVELNGEFAGYVNVIWTSGYPSFQEQGIPEINDFNVLMKFQRQGVGSKLMDHAENVVRERSGVAGHWCRCICGLWKSPGVIRTSWIYSRRAGTSPR